MLTGGTGFGNKPRALMCYICGREYGTTSLQIHLKTCMKKWDIEESKKPKKDRRPMPQPPRQLVEVLNKINAGGNVNFAELDSYNTKANDEYNDSALIRCEYCNRTFLPERLGIHRKICTPDKPFKPLPPPSTGGKSNAMSGGSGFGAKGAGNTSYGYREEEQPKASAMSRGGGVARKPGAQAPSRGQYEEYNDDDYDNNYAPAKSMQSRTQPMAKSRNQNYGGGYSNMGGEVQDVNLVGCNLCGRRFAADRIDRHQKACTRAQKGEAKHAKKVAMAERKQAEVDRFIEKEAKYKKSNWREQHREFVENLKYNRKLKAVEDRGGDVRALGPPPKTSAIESNMVPCPYCSRKFNPQSAEKHINICKNVINKPKAVPGRPQQAPMRTTQTSSYGAPASKAVPTKQPAAASKLGGTGSYGSYGGGFDDYEQPSYNPNSYGGGMSQARQTGYGTSPKPMKKGGGFSTQHGNRGGSTQSLGAGFQGVQGMSATSSSRGGGFKQAPPVISTIGRNDQGYNSSNQQSSKTMKSGYRY